MICTPNKASFAVLFKIHAWDAFVERQLTRLRSVVADQNIYILYDQTHENFKPKTDLKTMCISEDIAARNGLLCFPKRQTFWYNNDYPLYIFSDNFPDYEYVFFCEYDCVIRADIHRIVDVMRDHEIDFIGQKVRSKINDWYWLPSVADYYPQELQIHGRLTCFSGFSRRFIKILRQKRISHSRSIAEVTTKRSANGVPLWPFCEAIVGAELALHNLKSECLSAFGTTDFYDWAPPHPEEQLSSIPSDFIHPVLDDERIMNSITSKMGWDLTDLFAGKSNMRAWFDSIPPDIAFPLLFRTFTGRKDWESVAMLARHAASHWL